MMCWKPGLSATTRSWEKAWNKFPLRASEGPSPADTLIEDFRPPLLWYKPAFLAPIPARGLLPYNPDGALFVSTFRHPSDPLSQHHSIACSRYTFLSVLIWGPLAMCEDLKHGWHSWGLTYWIVLHCNSLKLDYPGMPSSYHNGQCSFRHRPAK